MFGRPNTLGGDLFDQRRGQVEEHLTAGKTLGALGDQAHRLFRLQVHQQTLGGDEHPVGGVDAIHPAVVQSGLAHVGDPRGRGKQSLAEFDHRGQIYRHPLEQRVVDGLVQAPETGLKALREGNDRCRRMRTQIGDGTGVDRQRAQRHFLAPATEPIEVDVEGVAEFDGHRIVDDRVRQARLMGPALQRHQRGLRDAAEHAGVDFRGSVHLSQATGGLAVGFRRDPPRLRRQTARGDHR